ncbi:MCE family protein [Rhodococcus triatomae]|nr:MCE family protein [Rhodococcus triatomae BKS 15-14]
MTRSLRLRLTVFGLVGLIAVAVVAVRYAQLPQQAGVGRYEVTLELPDGAGLYPQANVTYRGTEIGRVTDLDAVPGGARAVLSLDSDVPVPADVDAEAHSMSAIGEQFVDLIPASAGDPFLADGSVIPRERTSVPQRIGTTLDLLYAALSSVDPEALRRVLDESFTAVNGSGPALADLVTSTGDLAEAAAADRDPLAALVTDAAPVLDPLAASSDAIRSWASSLSSVTGEVAAVDPSVRSLLTNGTPAADEVRALIERLRPTLPVLLANLTSVAQVAQVYNPAIEQLLVLYPPIIASTQSAGLVNADDPGQNTFFLAQLNDPPPCTTGFLPASERRPPTETDTVPTPPGLYCSVAPDDPRSVRGSRNLPCLEYPGLRAATVQMCREAAGAAPR